MENDKSITYFTIQHQYNGVGEWVFSNFENIANAAKSKPHLSDEAHKLFNKISNYGFNSIDTGLEALNLVIIDNYNQHNTHKFRLVKVLHTFAIVTPIN